MDIVNSWISIINDVLWSYLLIIMLLGCAIWFTFKTRFVQFRMIKEMIKLLGDSTGKSKTVKNISLLFRHLPYRWPAVSERAIWRE